MNLILQNSMGGAPGGVIRAVAMDAGGLALIHSDSRLVRTALSSLASS